MKVILVADGRSEVGGTPLLMRHPRMGDPLEPPARALAAITRKRAKGEADHAEMARIEWFGNLYANGNGPAMPGWNIIRCLQDGAKRRKKGADVLRGVMPIDEHADLTYTGDDIRDPEELWKDGRFTDRQLVGVGQSRTPRTRPIWHEWGFELNVEVNLEIFDLDVLALCWEDAGRFIGIGDNRPKYGRFKGTIRVPEEEK